jgi:uncharacterized DUF497 family protein
MEKYDALHSIFEDRWKVIGFYNEFITVIAKFLPGDTARIISAWKSKPLEIEEYKNG